MQDTASSQFPAEESARRQDQPTSRLRRYALAAAFVTGVLIPASVSAQDQLPVVTAAKPVVRDIVEDDEFVGRFEAVDEVAIRSRVAGYLDEVHFKDGALVNKDELLFTIDQRPYQAAYDAAKSQIDVCEQPARILQGATGARRGARQDRQHRGLDRR